MTVEKRKSLYIDLQYQLKKKGIDLLTWCTERGLNKNILSQNMGGHITEREEYTLAVKKYLRGE